MDPVKMHRSLSNHESQVVLRIHLTETIVRAGSKDEEILRSLGLCITAVIPLRIIGVRVGVYFWVTKCRVYRGNDHGAWKLISHKLWIGLGHLPLGTV